MGSTVLTAATQRSRMPITRNMASVSRHHKPRIQSWRCTVLLLVTLLAAFLPTVAADLGYILAPTSVVAFSISTPTPVAPVETLIRDNRVPIMQNGRWTFLSVEEANELRRRDDIGTAVTTAAPETTKAATTVTTKTASSSPLPSIFDSSLASNFSDDSACPSFINSFLTNPTFKKCYPFSLLLQGSRSFFEAEKSLVSITQVLDATCASNATFCTSYLNSLATNLTDNANCGVDYQLGNSIVVEAYLGMIAYGPLYAASCLKDPDTSLYCYANAITNLTTPANVYFYYLPLNISLPGSSIPSCNWCLQQTMAVFRSASANRKQPIASTYASAAQQVDTICGPTFVNDTLPEAISAAGISMLRQGLSLSWLAPALILSVGAHLLLF